MTDSEPTLDQQLGYVADELGLQREFSDDDGCIHEQDPAVYLLTGNGMLAIIEAMRERGYDLDTDTIADMSYASFRRSLWKACEVCQASNNRLPDAVAQAAYAALAYAELIADRCAG